MICIAEIFPYFVLPKYGFIFSSLTTQSRAIKKRGKPLFLLLVAVFSENKRSFLLISSNIDIAFFSLYKRKTQPLNCHCEKVCENLKLAIKLVLPFLSTHCHNRIAFRAKAHTLYFL